MGAKRYALVGTGHRGSGMFARPLSRDFPATAELAAVVDANPLRMAAVVADLGLNVPTFTDFDAMMSAVDPDAVVVATRDATHAEYIIGALKAGKRAISEKPLCTTAEQCRAILAAAAKSKGRCMVTHNARYGSAERTMHAIVRSGRLGKISFMQFDETLDRCHGADYFRRWHCRKANSGGLLIHKASHHFDILNFLAASKPARVSAVGALKFYGRNGPFRHKHCRGCPHADRCDFYTDFTKREVYKKMYLDAESADGYFRDGCVFAADIDAEDQMAVLIEYQSGLQVSYTLTAYSPYESQRVIIEGSDARLEYHAGMNTGWIVDSKPMPGVEQIARETLRLFDPKTGAEDVPIVRLEGGHGGADPALRADFFGRDWSEPPNEYMASVEEAVQAVLIGAAANESMATGRPVDVQALLNDREAGRP